MKQMLVTIGAAITLLVAPAWAQKPAADHSAHHGAAQDKGALAEGEIRKVDKEAKKLTIKHGPMPSLDMPPMTMVFQVKDPAMLDKVKPGDKVQFKAEKLGGAFTVTEIAPAR
jgi:Cu(I)/Ag(I) efflux system periplasmic protein CusF